MSKMCKEYECKLKQQKLLSANIKNYFGRSFLSNESINNMFATSPSD